MASKTYGADSFSRQLSHPITAVPVSYIDPGVEVRWEFYYHIYYNYKVSNVLSHEEDKLMYF